MNVLVTGASGGIGSAISREFLGRGHNVFGLDLLAPSVSGGGYRHFVADVAEPDSLPEIGAINVIVNCAGVQGRNDIEVNLMGTINVTEKYLSPKIVSVVNIASASAHTGAEFPAYSASKGGILAYTKNVARRIARYGATCNSISPGGVRTEMNRPVMDDEMLWRQIMDLTPLKKWAEPEEIARWTYFLAVTNKSATGIDVIIDNGENTCGGKFIWP